ncbi:K(+)-transporting ATPase subunit F [Pseudonocardia xinjiangensis]|uniref:K(+)-transporting ATPase subunit F n=1 Tax=Pseudonocardia xinjiangensis TaxID=75289 RepID=A0ABX1RQR6_9PSEU|nr:K(+)-transporting ATPase subunit F [Pseudonocardia xinjiangensis]
MLAHRSATWWAGVSWWRRNDGRPGLRGADDRRFRGPRPDDERARVAVNAAAYIAGGLIALGLLIYLFVALLRPERF